MSICNSDPVFYFMISLGSSEILSYRFAGSMPLVGKRAVICRDVPLFEAFPYPLNLIPGERFFAISPCRQGIIPFLPRGVVLVHPENRDLCKHLAPRETNLPGQEKGTVPFSSSPLMLE